MGTFSYKTNDEQTISGPSSNFSLLLHEKLFCKGLSSWVAAGSLLSVLSNPSPSAWPVATQGLHEGSSIQTLRSFPAQTPERQSLALLWLESRGDSRAHVLGVALCMLLA